jgi:large subunit ribosomal protein L32
MAVPKRRRTSSAAAQRRMHLFIAPVALASCKKCGKKYRPHTICQQCGYYKGKEFINILSRLSKKERKIKEREMQETAKSQKAVSPLAVDDVIQKN